MTDDPRFTRFGEAVWLRITNMGNRYCWGEESEDILPLAQAAGLCSRVEYDPEIHGADIEADPGDLIWWWGKLEEMHYPCDVGTLCAHNVIADVPMSRDWEAVTCPKCLKRKPEAGK